MKGFLILSMVLIASGVQAKPDLSGTYDAATITPLERPAFLGETKHFYKWVAKTVGWLAKSGLSLAAEAASDPNREAPPVGGDGSGQGFGAGNVGGYNAFWIDPGTSAFEIDGKYRTSIVIDPPNGRQPQMTEYGRTQLANNFTSFSYVNTGKATWLDADGPGPFDGPENLALAERCLLGFSAGPPMLPGLYNNYKRVIQTEDHVMILLEMVHDARIIRLNSEHRADGARTWLGDSIGWWEGDTLVAETINFKQQTGLYGGDENLHLKEWFTRLANGDLLYKFTVTDPTAWTAPWTGEYSWRAQNQQKVYEYACHEGNYAMGNILRGARLLEQDVLAGVTGGAGD